MSRLIYRRLKKMTALVRNQSGLSLPETLVTVGIMGTTMLTFISALSVGSIAVNESNREMVGQRLARTQLEYIKSLPYNTSYASIDEPEGYAVSITVGPTPDNDASIQKITITVSREGEDILSVDGYKVDRQ